MLRCRAIRFRLTLVCTRSLVPNTVVQRNAESAFVYLLKPDETVAMQTITVATTDGNASAVEGIVPGVVVVADNFNRLTDGAKITVRSQTNTTSRAEAPNKGKRNPS